MPLKMKCPSCHKVLSVKESMVGKRAACPACKYMLTIPAAPVKKAAPAVPVPPAPAVNHTPPSAPVSETPPEDAEAIAAAMLGDEKKEGPAEAAKTIDFECPMCMEAIKMDIALAGKQHPCPECKRIIKIPLPSTGKPNWRQAPTRPTAARLDTEPAPEGAWGTTVGKSIVSRESLEDAGALPDKRPPLTVRQWISRGFVWAAIATFLVGGTMYAVSWFSSRKQATLLAKAMETVEGKEPKLKGASAGVFYLTAGRFHLSRNEPDSVLPETGDGARRVLERSRGLLAYKAGSEPERDALLIDLALTQLDMGGTGKAVEVRQRLGWKETRDDVMETLRAIRVPDGKAQPDARIEGVREVTRKLLRKEQAALAEEIGQRIGDGPVSPAVVGIELLRAGNNEAAKRLNELALRFYKIETPLPKKDRKEEGATKTTLPPLTVEVVALAVALGQEQKLPPVQEQEQIRILDMGKAVAKALTGSAAEAQKAANNLLTPAMKFEGLVAVADLLKDEGDSKAATDDALRYLSGELGRQVISPWLLVRLMRVGLERGFGESALTPVLDRFGNDPLRGWGQLLLFRSKLPAGGDKVDEAEVDKVESKYLSHGLARYELARHNRRKDKGTLDVVEKWDDAQRGFGLLGVLTAMKENK